MTIAHHHTHQPAHAQNESVALLPYPSKLYVETTTRCNLQCGMCVKQTHGCGIADADMTPALYAAIEPALPQLESLVLNGIGEPLLHPQLEQFICIAKRQMPTQGRVGFQTNGVLLTTERAKTLAQAGLDRICLSLDGANPDTFRRVRKGGELEGIENALSALRSARGANLQIGVEFVLRQDNLTELPQALKWAAGRGADFAIVTHMIAYDQSAAAQVAYDQNTDEAVALFDIWQQRATHLNIEIADYFTIRWKYTKTASEQRIVDFVEAMVTEASDRDIAFHLRSLIARKQRMAETLQALFTKAEQVAADTGLTLRLPALFPRAAKQCTFVETGSAFVSVTGDVHPCYFLWHNYRSYVSGWRKHVTGRSFGNLAQEQILDIWNDPEYREFRKTVTAYDYPMCSNCNVAPCDYVDSECFEQDCYTNTIPCCDCQWCLGVFQCLE